MSARPILPLPSNFGAHPFRHDQSPDRPNQPPGPNRPTYAKRGKITIVACVPCRRRKTKCDGKRPACSQCIAREGACLYDMTDEQRRLTFLRDNVEHLEEEKNALESLAYALKTSTDEEVGNIIGQLRSSPNVNTVAQSLASRGSPRERRESSTLRSPGYDPTPASPVGSGNRLEQYEALVRRLAISNQADLNEIIRRLRASDEISSILSAIQTDSLLQVLSTREIDFHPGIETDYSTREQTFGLVKGTTTSLSESNRTPHAHTPLVNQQPWTSVTNDFEFIEHLLSLYFSWQHSFFQSFPEKLFREDMVTGGTRYCSRLLVNALCATGCLLSRRPEARRDPSDPRTAGLDFFDEAVKLLNETRTSSIPTTAALYLLCHIEGNRGQLSLLWMYSGRSSRMALDINLHLRSERTSESQSPTSKEDAARLHAFWGCFIADQVTSFTLGRLPQIPINAITVDLPPIDEDQDQEPWLPYDSSSVKRPGARSTTFNQVAALSKIVNSTLLMFFAPSQIISGSILLDEYQKYLNWYGRLPKVISSIDDSPPHVLCLHMYYHAAVLLLFRPFLKAHFTESDISPREVCRQSANAISDIFATHRRMYDLTGLNTFQVHCLSTACTIHIINVPTILSTKYLTVACNDFQDLVNRNEWAIGSLNIIKSLVQKWNIILPLEAETALYRDQNTRSNFDLRDSSQAPDDFFPGSASNTIPEKRPHLVGPASQILQKRQRLTQRETSGQLMNYLFAPSPNQPAPLLGPLHTSTTTDEREMNDELNLVAQGFDGLNFLGDDWFDPFMGFQGEGNPGL